MRNVTLVATAVFVFLGGTATLRADDAADAHAIIDKAIKAMGGPDKLKKTVCLTSKLKGKVKVMGLELEISATSYIQEPDRIRVETELSVMGQDIKQVQVFNKDKGWISTNGMTMEMDEAMIASAKEQLYQSEVNRLVGLRDKEYKLSTLGATKIAGTDAVGVHVERKGRPDYNMYFDKTTFLLVKTEGREKDASSGTEVNAENFLSDYKEIDGVKMPQKIKVLRDGKEFLTGTVSDTKFEDKLSDTLFEKP